MLCITANFAARCLRRTDSCTAASVVGGFPSDHSTVRYIRAAVYWAHHMAPHRLESLIKTFVAHFGQVLRGEICLVVPGVDGPFSGSDGFGDRPASIDRIG